MQHSHVWCQVMHWEQQEGTPPTLEGDGSDHERRKDGDVVVDRARVQVDQEHDLQRCVLLRGGLPPICPELVNGTPDKAEIVFFW